MSTGAINQIIRTIQCEGDLLGVPSVLVRLNGCNCKCPWCDTKYTWNNSIPQITDEDLESVLKIHELSPNIRMLMVTGGEPLLYANQANFYQLLNLEHFDLVSIETNGTKLKLLEFDELYKHLQLNISPKLDIEDYSSPEDYQDLINFISDQDNFPNEYMVNPTFKFVLDVDSDRGYKILKFINDTKIREQYGSFSIKIMSQTPNRIEFESLYDWFDAIKANDLKAVEFCMTHGLTFTPRDHLRLFPSKQESLTEMETILKK